MLPEVVAEAATLLERLREHLVLAYVVVADRAARELHGLLEVIASNLGHRVLVNVHGVEGSATTTVGGALALALYLLVDALADGELARSLADLGQVGAAEAVRRLGQVVEVHVLGDGRLAQRRLEYVDARLLVRQRDVDELIEATGAQHGRVDDVRPVGGADDEHVLLGAHAVHFGEHLVDDAIGGAAAVAAAAAARLGYGVELVEEEHTRRRLARLVEHVAHVRLRLAEPHGEQLGALDRDEVGLALVGDGLGEQRLAAAGRAVEEDAARRRHAELEELLRMLDRILDELLELALDVLEAADVLPRHVGHLDDRFAQGARVALAEGPLEVLVRDGERVEHFGVDALLLEVDEVHLLADLLQRRLRAQRGQIGAHVAVRLVGDLLEVDVVAELHVLGVNAEYFEASDGVRNADVDLAVKATEASQGRVDAVRPVGGGHDDDVRALLEAVHEREELRDDASLDLAVRLLALGRNGVQLVDEYDRGRVLLGRLERLAQVGLGLARQLAHDLRAVDEEEEGARLVGDGARYQRLARARRSEEQDAARRLHADRLEELRMTQRQLDHLLDLGELFAHAADVVVADLVERALLVLALHRLAIAPYDRVGHDHAVRRRLALDHLELDGAHVAAHEYVALAHRPIRLEEVGLEERLVQVAREALDRVVDGQDGDRLAVLDVRTRLDGDDVADAHAQVGAHHPVHAHLLVGARVVGEHHAHRLLALLALDDDRVGAEQLELVHLRLRESDDRVVVVERLLDDEPIGFALLLEDGRRQVVFLVRIGRFGHYAPAPAAYRYISAWLILLCC